MVPCLFQRKASRPDSAKGSMAARCRSTGATSRCDGANAKKYAIWLTGRDEYGPGFCSGRSGHGSKANADAAADVRPADDGSANVLAAAYVWNAATHDAAAHDAVAHDAVAYVWSANVADDGPVTNVWITADDGPTTRLWSATYDGSATDGSTITTDGPATNGPTTNGPATDGPVTKYLP